MSSTDLQPLVSLLDTVLGNRAGSTARTTIANLALQLAGSGLLPAEMIYPASWAALLTIAGTRNGQGAEVIESDAGTHLAATSTGYNGASVPNAGRYTWNSSWSRWVRIGSSGLASVLAALETVPTSEEYETTDDTIKWAFSDGLGRILFSSADFDKPALTSEIYESTDPENSVVFIDEAGRVLAKVGGGDEVPADTGPSEEMIAARGSKTTLGARLDVSIDAAGWPIDYEWGSWYLRETRMRLRCLKRAEAMKFGIAILGDSWSHNATRWSGPVAEALTAEYGSYGSGWIGFGYPNTSTQLRNGSVLTGLYSTTVPSGAWTSTYYTANTADAALLTSSSAGANLQVSGPAADTTFILHYVGTADGVVRYRWNGGAWSTNLALPDGSPAGTVQTVALTGKPAGAWTLQIEVVSGTVNLCGLTCSRDASGVLVHKLAATGSHSGQWAALDATKWQAAYAALGQVNLGILMYGTNDQRSVFIPDFKTNISTLIDRMRAVTPSTDILLVPACENGRTDNPRPMSQYIAAMHEVAATKKCAFLNLQPLFGELYADYAPGSARPWFFSDTIHPDPPTGGRVIADAILRLLTQH
ncbi:hypothetical protein ELG78_16765 [Rhizobium leguminosarum]|uniref:SGNH/GDSL hydrolase family protein n=1 Tax=Rhizobium leguminosarum TaxID=384 RepID=UPI0010312036|nr:GDSL-type esterase/lipase family protein [Rhizobium leguminosarum]TBG38531.1 hypothetical protein ELG78_16765 [Rhizobium leguminosarum]